ncbi:MAG TPA: nucleoside deaminase [Anaerolineae bacterium]|nr:nucleoside deaminase [Anaerolineae bacterium]
MSIHEAFMRRCLELARIALYEGDAPVGSLVVRHGQIIAEGVEGVKAQQDVTWHAEIDAVRKACRALGTLDLKDCTLYTNVEPCVMCSYAIRQTGISQVVIGMETASLGGVSSAYAILSDSTIPGWGSPPVVVTDILKEECLQLRSRYS